VTEAGKDALMGDDKVTTKVRGQWRRVWRIVLVVALIAAAYGIGVSQSTIVRPALVLGQDAVTDAQSARATVTLDDVGGQVIHIAATGQRKVVLIFYPGGLVRPQAYEWLGRALAAQGVETWIPVMPFDLAVTGINRADAIIAHIGTGVPVVIGGHSLGGAMASDYASRHAAQLKGLVLFGAYPASNVTVTASWPALSVRAGNDGVAKAADVEGGMSRLPTGSQLVVVAGSIHAFFGRYGPQAGDGLPTITHADAEQAILAAVGSYLASLT
jgi:pimeloyl-ACP methyl ester carboxylesterase